MGWDYALVHLTYTIPLAFLLSVVYYPLSTRLDFYRISFLITIAVIYTIPWDSYLIRTRVWTYPEHVIVGPTLFRIPLEELFFFVIQTYITSLVYLISNKPVLHPLNLRTAQNDYRIIKYCGHVVLAALLAIGWHWSRGGNGTYMGLILLWAVPVLLLLWSLSYQLLISLFYPNVIFCVAVPTLYLWVVDTLALRKGTWVIESGTKFGIEVWPALEIEEAVFFLTTNILVVFGLTAFDNAIAILNTFPTIWPTVPVMPSPLLLIQSLMLPTHRYDQDRIDSLNKSVDRLQKKSKSFYVASATFPGRIRIDLIFLYSFCRVADDLIDDSKSADDARRWIEKIQTFLRLSFDQEKLEVVEVFVRENFPADYQQALLSLPVSYLSSRPLYDLLKGFGMDLDFFSDKSLKSRNNPVIKAEEDLAFYGLCVAGTVSELCLDIAFHHAGGNIPAADKVALKRAGQQMGTALQYVNIARDVTVDAKLNRVYFPDTWLQEMGLDMGRVLEDPLSEEVAALRLRLLRKAFVYYGSSKETIELLPPEIRGPMRAAVDSYMEIGLVLMKKSPAFRPGRVKVPRPRRLFVAWRALLTAKSNVL